MATLHLSPMHRHVLPFALALSVLASGLTWAQAPVTPASASATAKPSHPEPVEQRLERIHVEDKASTIDEVRVGGQTQSIDVQPKNGMPAYQVSPTDGQRSWKVLGF